MPVNSIDEIGRLPYRFIAPAEVAAEIRAGLTQGYPSGIPAWLDVLPLSAPVSSVAAATLDAGEAAVIQLAQEQGVQKVCLDDLKGRRAALAVGLQVVGSLGLLARAKTLGLIPVVRPLLETAHQAGIYYGVNLVEDFLRQIGE
jgi:predicted nucleic acid-binding protein